MVKILIPLLHYTHHYNKTYGLIRFSLFQKYINNFIYFMPPYYQCCWILFKNIFTQSQLLKLNKFTLEQHTKPSICYVVGPFLEFIIYINWVSIVTAILNQQQQIFQKSIQCVSIKKFCWTLKIMFMYFCNKSNTKTSKLWNLLL